LKQIDGSIQIADLTIQPLQRERDYYIMDAAVTLPDFSPAVIRQINYCRLYLQILTISDMTNATGTRLAPGIRHGTHLWSQSKSKFQEIHQELPNEASWSIWRRFLNTISNFHGYLFTPLMGPWLFPADRLRRLWPLVLSPSSDSLYVHSSDEYQIHSCVRVRIYSFTMITTVRLQPGDGVPIDCTEASDGWRIPGVIGPPTVSTPCILAPTFDVFIDQQPTHIVALLPRIY
jgi:hypothetical protein